MLLFIEMTIQTRRNKAVAIWNWFSTNSAAARHDENYDRNAEDADGVDEANKRKVCKRV